MLTSVNPNQLSSGRNFRQAYCEKFGCLPADYANKVFWRCLYPHARLLAPLLLWLNKGYFELSFQTIHELGETANYNDFKAELDGFTLANRNARSLLRKRLRVRVSGRRLMALQAAVWG